MMNKLFTLSLILSSALLLCWSLPSTNAAQSKGELVNEVATDSYKVVRLHSYGGISPQVLKIKPGTIVIWVNDSRSEISIKFVEKQLHLACKSPVHFVADDQGFYVAKQIPQDTVASLCFVEKGEFNYVTRGFYIETGVKSLGKIKEYKGKIIVE